MSDQTYILIIGAIIGFLSATLKDFINYYFKSKKEKNEATLKRLDESFTYLSKSYSYNTKIFTNNISNNKIEDNTDSIKLSFLIRTYFIDLLPYFNKLSISTMEFTQFQIIRANEFNLTIERQGYSKKLYDELFVKYITSEEYLKYYEIFITDYKNLCDAIINETKKHK